MASNTLTNSTTTKYLFQDYLTTSLRPLQESFKTTLKTLQDPFQSNQDHLKNTLRLLKDLFFANRWATSRNFQDYSNTNSTLLSLALLNSTLLHLILISSTLGTPSLAKILYWTDGWQVGLAVQIMLLSSVGLRLSCTWQKLNEKYRYLYCSCTDTVYRALY